MSHRSNSPRPPRPAPRHAAVRSALPLLLVSIVCQGCVCGAPEPAPQKRPATRRARAAQAAATPPAELRQQVERMERETRRRDREARQKQDGIHKEAARLESQLASASSAERKQKLRARLDTLRRDTQAIRTSRDRARRRELDRVEQFRLKRKRSGR